MVKYIEKSLENRNLQRQETSHGPVRYKAFRNICSLLFYIQQISYEWHCCVSDLHSVWWGWRHVADQLAPRLSETCYTGLLMSEAPVWLHFFCKSLVSHCEYHCTLYDSVSSFWGEDPVVQSLARLRLKVETSVSWWKPAAREALYLQNVTNTEITHVFWGQCIQQIVMYTADNVFLSCWCLT